MKKKILLFVMFILSCLNFPLSVLADTNVTESLTSTKEAIKTNNVGEYEIKISVPGKEHEKISNYNVLFVIDASESMKKDKWTATRNSLLEMVNILLPENKESNVNKIGLMSFGIDWHLNIELTNDKSKFYALPENYYDAAEQLLAPGRSATNTEAALNGAYEYLSSLNNKKDKEHTYVIFLTDAEANYSEAKYNFYELSQKVSNGNLVRSYYLETLIVLSQNKDVKRASLFDDSINEITNLYQEKNPDVNIEEKTFIDMIDALYGTNELDKILTDGVIALHAFKGLDVTKSYSINEVERAIFSKVSVEDKKIEKELVEESFYIELISKHPTSDSIEVERTVKAGKKLAEISTVYTIGFGACTKWESKMILDPTYYNEQTNDKHYSSGYSLANTTTLKEKFIELTSEIVKIKYKNAEVVDYTSKWVQPLDVNGDGLFDEKDITIRNNGEVIDSKNISVRKLTEEEISDLNDNELNNNTNGDIYEIKWEISEYLRSWDKFELSYKVKVDTQEENFESNKDYKANGKTTLIYDVVSKSNINSEETIIEEDVEYDIEVPTVKQEENVVIIKKTDEEGNALDGADFELEENDGTVNYKKEYSVDGETWTSTNEGNKAIYFKFSGMYDYIYNINETLTPNQYVTASGKIISFINQEGIFKYYEIQNERLKGNVIINYVDEHGNNLLEGIVLSSKVGDEYKSFAKDIENYELIEVKGNEAGFYINGDIYITYIYSEKILPPHTGISVELIEYINFNQPVILDKKRYDF